VFLSLVPIIAGMDWSFLTVVREIPMRQSVGTYVCGLSGIDWDGKGGPRLGK